MVNIGRSIKERRKMLKLSQKELAKMAGLSRVQISNIERNVSNPKYFTVMKIFKVLNMM
jgi:transcriptional regulator with XRE-family HTH domain